jgi:hypothetical protein
LLSRDRLAGLATELLESPVTDLRNRARAAMALIFVGDALSMPVHWFYRQGDILKQFPPAGIRGFEAAPEVHPGSIMALHSTGRGGRGRQAPQEAVVGQLILKDKASYWNRPNIHYHHGLPAGENTLNAWCARWMMNWLRQQDIHHLSVERWLAHYVDQMTADPASHPDTYAESYHREFFANVRLGKPLLECGGHTHDTPSMGGLVIIAPLAMALLTVKSVDETSEVCRAFVYATHPDALLMQVVDAYVQLIDQLLNQREVDVKAAILDAAAVLANGNIARLIPDGEIADKKILALVAQDTEVIGRTYSPACYITDSWPGVCYLAARYAVAPETGLLVNTNLGGENAHRGSVLGCLLGLLSGQTTAFYPQLHRYDALQPDIQAWCDTFYPAG